MRSSARGGDLSPVAPGPKSAGQNGSPTHPALDCPPEAPAKDAGGLDRVVFGVTDERRLAQWFGLRSAGKGLVEIALEQTQVLEALDLGDALKDAAHVGEPQAVGVVLDHAQDGPAAAEARDLAHVVPQRRGVDLQPGLGAPERDPRQRQGRAEEQADAELARQFRALDTDNSGKLDSGEFARFEAGDAASTIESYPAR